MTLKRIKLSIFTLISLLGISLTSCNEGIKGDKGETGDQGEQGEPGIDGEDGKDGIPGSEWLTGIGEPSNDLGKVGDMYLDTSTNNVYQKESSGWVLKTNIKGEDGKDGEDGNNGSNGSNGSNSQKVASSTILPSENGTITVDKGSQIVGEEVTFTFIPNDSNTYLNSLSINNNDINIDEVNYIEEEHIYTLTVEMEERGLVVKATFINIESSIEEDLYEYNMEFNSYYEGYESSLTFNSLSYKFLSSNSSENFNIGININEGSTLMINNLNAATSNNPSFIPLNSLSRDDINRYGSYSLSLEESNDNEVTYLIYEEDLSSYKELVFNTNGISNTTLNEFIEIIKDKIVHLIKNNSSLHEESVNNKNFLIGKISYDYETKTIQSDDEFYLRDKFEENEFPLKEGCDISGFDSPGIEIVYKGILDTDIDHYYVYDEDKTLICRTRIEMSDSGYTFDFFSEFRKFEKDKELFILNTQLEDPNDELETNDKFVGRITHYGDDWQGSQNNFFAYDKVSGEKKSLIASGVSGINSYYLGINEEIDKLYLYSSDTSLLGILEASNDVELEGCTVFSVTLDEINDLSMGNRLLYLLRYYYETDAMESGSKIVDLCYYKVKTTNEDGIDIYKIRVDGTQVDPDSVNVSLKTTPPTLSSSYSGTSTIQNQTKEDLLLRTIGFSKNFLYKFKFNDVIYTIDRSEWLDNGRETVLVYYSTEFSLNDLPDTDGETLTTVTFYVA